MNTRRQVVDRRWGGCLVVWSMILCGGAQGGVPSDVGGLALWFSADVGVHTNAGGVVTNWVDQAAGIAATNTSATPVMPTFVANFNSSGKPALYWSASTNYGLKTPNLSITNNQARTLFLVARVPTAVGANNEVFGRGTSYRVDLGGTGSSSNKISLRNGTDYYYTPAGSFAYNTVYIVVVRAYDDANKTIQVFQNGTLVGTSADGIGYFHYALTVPLGIGWSTYVNATQFRSYEGHLAEVILYDHALSDANHNLVGYYLKQKYNIATASYGEAVGVENRPEVVIRRSDTAVLGGRITSANPADLWFLWSTNASLGKTTAGWDGTNIVVNAATDVVHTVTASNLLPGKTYTWRCYATNAADGDGWATTTATLTTPGSLHAYDAPPVTAGLALHLDASVLPYADGAHFEWWPEGRAGGLEFTRTKADEAYWPSFVASEAAVGGKPVVRFAREEGLDGSVPGFVAEKDRTVFIVAIPSAATGGSGQLIGQSTSAMIDLAADRLNANDNAVRIRRSDNAYSPNNSLSMGQPHIVAVTDGAADSPPTAIYIDGAAQAVTYDVGSSGTRYFGWPMSSSVELGYCSAPNADRGYVGDLAELLLYDRVLTSNEQQRVGAHLEKKYGLATAYEWSRAGTVFVWR